MTKTSDDGPARGADADAEGGDLVQQARYEREGRHDLTTTIVVAIADAEGVSPTDLTDPVLYECVDLAALEDAFFGPAVAGESRDSVGTVTFQYGGYRVEVGSDGWISVYE